MRLAVMVLAGLLAGSPALAADQFDLVCKGESRINGEPWKSEDRIYRIDLTNRRWCYEKCEVAKPIQDVTADQIVLERGKQPYPIDGEANHEISRHTGRVNDTVYASFGAVFYRGDCEPASFSGLPTPKF